MAGGHVLQQGWLVAMWDGAAGGQREPPPAPLISASASLHRLGVPCWWPLPVSGMSSLEPAASTMGIANAARQNATSLLAE